MMTPYKMEINNAARYILANPADSFLSVPIDIFQFSLILGIVHCKAQEEVLTDILNAQRILKKF